MPQLNFAKVETRKDRTMSQHERTVIHQLDFGIQALWEAKEGRVLELGPSTFPRKLRKDSSAAVGHWPTRRGTISSSSVSEFSRTARER